MSTALVTIDQNPAALALAATNKALELGVSTEEFDQLKTIRPVALALMQPTTNAEGVMPGQFFDRQSGNQFGTKLQFIILGISSPRAKYPSDKFKAGEKPMCKSRDGKKPIVDDPNLVPQALSCDACEHSSWKGYNSKTKTGKKPTCRDMRRILMLEMSTTLPYFMTIQGMGVKTVKTLQETIVRSMLAQNRKLKTSGSDRKLTVSDFLVTVQSEKATSGEPYYNLVPKRIDPLTEEQKADFMPMLLAMEAKRHEWEAEQDAREAAEEEAAATSEVAEQQTEPQQYENA